MKLRTYQAYSMAEALAAVKRDLGANAVILNTRSFKRGGVLGIGRKTIIEVTATPTGPQGRLVSEPKPQQAGAAAARRAYGAKPSKATTREVTETDQLRTRRLAQAMAARFEQQNTAAVATNAHPAGSASAVTSTAAVPPGSEGVKEQPAATGAKQQPAPMQRFILATPDREPIDRNISTSEPAKSNHASGRSDAMHDELSAIKVMVGQVLQRQTRNASGPSPAMPAKLFDMYLQLIAQDLSEELADTIINDVRDTLSRDQLEDEQIVRETVMQQLASQIPIAEQPIALQSPDDRPLTIALIGPTGVGKTTTLAKLAATYKLRQHCNVGLITSDTYRIAAVDQLRTYANIIGLPLQVALTPAEMRQAVHSLSECDVILIDTAGRGQNDTARLEELKDFLDAAQPHEVHLVLSSTANEKVLMREAEAFSEVGINKVVLTKLDEAVNFGMLINVVRKVGKELSFMTTGQEVPNHLEPGRADRLPDLVLGGNVHS